MIVTGCVRRLAFQSPSAAANVAVLSHGKVLAATDAFRGRISACHQTEHRRLNNSLARQVPWVSPGETGSAPDKTGLLEFNKMFPDIVRDLTHTGRHLDVPRATKWFAKVLQYNMTGGKKYRGLAVVQSYRLLARNHEPTPEDIRLAIIMGWCLEMLHTSLLMTQDTVEQADTRRGKPCWYLASDLVSNAGVALNDASLLETGIYQLLKIHFEDKPYYVDVLELFHDVSHKAIMGQVMDTETRADRSLQQFTMERYRTITKYRTAYHTFQMPVSLALYMAGIRDVETHRQAKTILMEMGQFYQVLADFLNCYGDPELTGRVGTDIENGKCTWLSVVALQRASDPQLQVLQECYGSKHPEKVAKVKQLYNILGLPSTYKIYEDQTYALLCTQIQQITRGLPHKLFFKFLQKVYVKDAYISRPIR
ncbi:Farnesyl pyrophosphate synthase [Cryptotermes secundus]|uniref:Farnesyl pyrophosphate synthase n=1 Tax=Cryptotermes secundus TaxID=105785 RepID=A0A2J7PU49_9NEOP|nr:farnesyl pyrophosphate synthase [Cryptotermes secundus]PNF19861.1 Farnesyl pyrophosphate synthase [Cryptotermes secundus]